EIGRGDGEDAEQQLPQPEPLLRPGDAAVLREGGAGAPPRQPDHRRADRQDDHDEDALRHPLQCGLYGRLSPQLPPEDLRLLARDLAGARPRARPDRWLRRCRRRRWQRTVVSERGGSIRVPHWLDSRNRIPRRTSADTRTDRVLSLDPPVRIFRSPMYASCRGNVVPA